MPKDSPLAEAECASVLLPKEKVLVKKARLEVTPSNLNQQIGDGMDMNTHRLNLQEKE